MNSYYRSLPTKCLPIDIISIDTRNFVEAEFLSIISVVDIMPLPIRTVSTDNETKKKLIPAPNKTPLSYSMYESIYNTNMCLIESNRYFSGLCYQLIRVH